MFTRISRTLLNILIQSHHLGDVLTSDNDPTVYTPFHSFFNTISPTILIAAGIISNFSINN